MVVLVIRVLLAYDPAHKQFRFLVGVELPGVSRPLRLEMIVDTGTNRSAISESAASHLGIDIGHLELRDTGGVTAIEKRPWIRDVTFWLVGEDVARVTLPEVLVLTDLRRKEKRAKGGRQTRPETRFEAPCLFGMDALEALGGRLVLDPRTGQGSIEW